MKVIRTSVKVTSGAVVSFAFIRANWFERRHLDRMMRSKRHNLRPAHNWAASRTHRASYIMKRKGVLNHDAGPDRTYIPPYLRFMLKTEFTWPDMIAMTLSFTLIDMGHTYSGWGVGLLCGAISIAARHKFKGVL